jgi:hypothetical protein
VIPFVYPLYTWHLGKKKKQDLTTGHVVAHFQAVSVKRDCVESICYGAKMRNLWKDVVGSHLIGRPSSQLILRQYVIRVQEIAGVHRESVGPTGAISGRFARTMTDERFAKRVTQMAYLLQDGHCKIMAFSSGNEIDRKCSGSGIKYVVSQV